MRREGGEATPRPISPPHLGPHWRRSHHSPRGSVAHCSRYMALRLARRVGDTWARALAGRGGGPAPRLRCDSASCCAAPPLSDEPPPPPPPPPPPLLPPPPRMAAAPHRIRDAAAAPSRALAGLAPRPSGSDQAVLFGLPGLLRRPTGSGPGFARPPACRGLDYHGMVWSPGPPDGMVMARQQPGASRTDYLSALP